MPAERLGLSGVRRRDEGKGQEPGDEGRDGVLPQEAVAALRHHDGVDDELPHAVMAEPFRHRLDDRCAGEHPGLDGVHADVGCDGVDLGGDHVDGQFVDGGDAERVLGGDGGERARAVDLEGGERLEVGLYARAASGVGACDGQRDGGASFVHTGHSSRFHAISQKRYS